MASARTDDAGPERDLEGILAAYLEEVESGRSPDRRAWVAGHPEFALELSAFFANLDHVARLADPFRTSPRAVGPDLLPFPAAPGDEGTRVSYFGDYELIRELGRGGMGVVYAARQVSLDRVLALKVLSASRPGSEADIQRFLREAVAAAALDHPSVVPIYEVGEHDGLHYYGMKLVDGGSLAQHVPRLKDDPRAAAEIIAQVARAVHYAHERGVLHRDLKPANVLLDRHGRPFVADFGLARRVDGDAGLTASGAVVGTPAYMAPEQAEGRRDAVTTAADVYGLGAILYEALTGRPPFQGDTVLEVLSRVRDAEAEPPSRVHPAVPRDLETVALKCLEKDPRRRYASAKAVADDLDRWLAGSPISARPATAPERALKWVRRKPTTAALILACVVATSAAATAFRGVFEAVRLRVEVGETDQKRQLEEKARRRAENELQRQAGRREAADAKGYGDRIAAAEQAWQANDVPKAERILDECPARLRGWEWHYLRRLCHGERLTIHGHNGTECSVAFTPDAARFTCPDDRLGLTIWDAGTGQKGVHLRGHDGTAYGVAFDRRGARLATAGGDGQVKLWDVASGKLLRILRGHGDWAASVAFSPDGSRLASSGSDRFVRVWDVATGDEVLSLAGHDGAVHGVAFSPDGKLIASGGKDGVLILWDALLGLEVRRLVGHAGATRCLAFSPDGARLAAGEADRSVRVWDVASGRETLSFRAASNRIDGLAFSPDGRRIATGSLDYSVKVWDAENGREVAAYRGHIAGVFSVAFSPDGRWLASASQDATVKLWDTTSGPEARVFRNAQGVRRAGVVAFGPDGTVVAATDAQRGVALFDVATGRELPTLRSAGGSTSALAFHPEGRLLALAAVDGAVQLADATTGETRLTWPSGQESLASLAFSADGSTVVTGGGYTVTVVQGLRGKGVPPSETKHAVSVFDATTGRERFTLPGHVGSVFALGVSPDGRRIASGGADGIIHLWDSQKGIALDHLTDQPGPVFTVAFSPDGRTLASGGDDGKVRVRDLASDEFAVWTGSLGWVLSLAFSPDGSRLVSAGGDGMVRIWETRRGRQLLSLRGPGDRVTSVAFSPDGQTLAAAADDGALWVWDTRPDSHPR